MASAHTASEWFSIGEQALAENAYDESIDAYTRALVLDPTFVSAYISRGRARMRCCQMALASEDFDHAIALTQCCERTFNLRGLCHATLGDYAAAYLDFNRALVLNPKFSAAALNRANALDELKRCGAHLLPDPAESAPAVDPEAAWFPDPVQVIEDTDPDPQQRDRA